MLWMEVMHAMLDLPRCHGPLHKESLPGMSLDCHHITSLCCQDSDQRESTASFRV